METSALTKAFFYASQQTLTTLPQTKLLNHVKRVFSDDRSNQELHAFIEWQLKISLLDTWNRNKYEHVGFVEEAYDLPETCRNLELLGVESGEDTYFEEDDLIICHGAGIDSTIACHWAKSAFGYKDPALVHIDYGAPFNAKERRAAKEITYRYNKLRTAATLRAKNIQNPVDRLSYINKFDDFKSNFVRLSAPLECTQEHMPKGYVIPLRNALLASSVCDMLQLGRKPVTIWIVANYNALDDALGTDPGKSRKFYGRVSYLLSKYHKRPITVTSPFLHMSKQDSIAWFLDEMVPIRINDTSGGEYVLSATTSCSDPDVHRCSNCHGCARLAHAIFPMGLKIEGLDVDLVHASAAYKAIVEREKRKSGSMPSFYKASE